MPTARLAAVGTTRLLLDRSAPDGRVIAFDLDPDAIARGEALGFGDRLVLVNASFGTLYDAAHAVDMLPLDGVLLDLGFSSFQIDDPERGFSLRLDGPLDMRFDRSSGSTAADLVNTLDEQSIADLIWRYGEDRNSRRIASAIVRERTQRPIETTAQLAEIVARASGGQRGKIHPGHADVSGVAYCDERRARRRWSARSTPRYGRFDRVDGWRSSAFIRWRIASSSSSLLA